MYTRLRGLSINGVFGVTSLGGFERMGCATPSQELDMNLGALDCTRSFPPEVANWKD